MEFQNLQVDPGELPQVNQLTFTSLSPSYLSVSFLGNGLFFGTMLLGIAGVFLLSEVGQILALAIGIPALWLISLLLTFWLIKKSYEIQGYAIREKDIVHRKGVIFRSVTTIPFNRIQHCEITEGPIERWFGLKTLEVFTAGGQSSDLRIPGLEGEIAQELKEFIVVNVGEIIEEDE